MKIRRHLISFMILPIIAAMLWNIPSADLMSHKTFADGRAYVDIRDFGAVGNGLTDDSGAIQKAIDAAAKTGAVVYIPGGMFRMAKGVKVPKGVSVEGSLSASTGPWQDWLDSEGKGGQRIFGSTAGALWASADYMRGSWILADNGQGDPNSDPTFLLDGNTAIRKLGFVNRSLTPVTSMPNLSPPHIAVYSEAMTAGAVNGVVIDNITLSNPYIGIAVAQKGSGILEQDTDKSNSKSQTGTVRISNIMGSPLYKGIIIKGISSRVELSNLQFNYSCYISSHVQMRMQMATDLEIMGSTDVHVTDMLTFGAYSGITTLPAYNGRISNLTAINLNLEGQKAISIKSSGTYKISNSYFFMVNFAGAAILKPFRAIEIAQDTTSSQPAVYDFTNCVLQNPIIFTEANNSQWEDIAIDLDLGGKAKATFTNFQIYGMDQSLQDPQIRYNRRSGSGTEVIFNNVNFISAFSNHLIRFTGSGWASDEVRFSNSRFPSGAQITSASQLSFKQCVIYNGASNSYYEN
ncbi:MAG: glycosyl hydrolase family 28-related protein [Eubacteriales bacterium]|nr:glycosyl hydrolase family 28-related protein [Eubacteriales bacterium]MDD4717866.1 glycosyl hydrolase family 28-related protein [Eubacteriales bacterium]